MKIGILTIFDVLNYGAVLQAYALQNVLRNLGNEVFIINYQPNELTMPYKSIHIKKFRNISYVLRLARRVFLFTPFRKFVKAYLAEGEYYSTYAQLLKSPPEADVFIVGSDQVWNTKLTGKSEAFYLPFGNKCKKIAYAASCGGNYSFLEDIAKVSFLKQFDAISVRENSLQAELKKKDIAAEVVLDPTLLLEDFNEFVQYNNFGDYILVYNIHLDSGFIAKLAHLKEKTKLRVLNIGPHYLSIADKNLLGISPAKWVKLLFHAKYVFTNSFHGVAFSINFKKSFLYLPTGTNSDLRVLDMLAEAELNHFIVFDKKDVDRIIGLKENLEKNGYLIAMRQRSLAFINKEILKND